MISDWVLVESEGGSCWLASFAMLPIFLVPSFVVCNLINVLAVSQRYIFYEFSLKIYNFFSFPTNIQNDHLMFLMMVSQ